ncbi:uncharacterized protein BJ171DRAFT_588754 [Polychytrium aggregatum]|uniref:uncharacterized protein n=1 Tax=Polychytrium aggregatum TaxID=110093 RepID=UPI0022FE900A|nr:uncharacterized protein BJ171DRAFT_588754 [Polychytrium aggregatum]KAI9193198.1 hypothetical protein BJ171DRAFT_588754 [Polychytrium aggregatum]
MSFKSTSEWVARLRQANPDCNQGKSVVDILTNLYVRSFPASSPASPIQCLLLSPESQTYGYFLPSTTGSSSAVNVFSCGNDSTCTTCQPDSSWVTSGNSCDYGDYEVIGDVRSNSSYQMGIDILKSPSLLTRYFFKTSNCSTLLWAEHRPLFQQCTSIGPNQYVITITDSSQLPQDIIYLGCTDSQCFNCQTAYIEHLESPSNVSSGSCTVASVSGGPLFESQYATLWDLHYQSQPYALMIGFPNSTASPPPPANTWLTPTPTIVIIFSGKPSIALLLCILGFVGYVLYRRRRSPAAQSDIQLETQEVEPLPQYERPPPSYE